MVQHPLRPSLTCEELKKIEVWERNHQSKVVRRLLAVVARLQQIALRADQLEKSIRADHASISFNSLDIVLDCLRRELDELPVIEECEAAEDFILHGHGNPLKRKGERR